VNVTLFGKFALAIFKLDDAISAYLSASGKHDAESPLYLP